MIKLILTVLLFASAGSSVAAQDAVYLIRHAEKEPSGADPALTTDGRKRASDWAIMLKHLGLSVIITSDAQRTRETGGIIADALGLPSTLVPRDDVAGLIDTMEFDYETDTVLVVAHAETIPQILKSLGVLEDVTIGQSEYANLYGVLRASSDAPIFIRLQMP